MRVTQTLFGIVPTILLYFPIYICNHTTRARTTAVTHTSCALSHASIRCIDYFFGDVTVHYIKISFFVLDHKSTSICDLIDYIRYKISITFNGNTIYILHQENTNFTKDTSRLIEHII